MFINVSRLLWAYDIIHAYEEQGGRKFRCEVDSMAFTNSFNSSPLPFRVTFAVRDSGVREIVESEWKAADKDVDSLLERIRAGQIRFKERAPV